MVRHDRAGQDAAQPLQGCELVRRRTYDLAKTSAQAIEKESQHAGTRRYEGKEEYREDGVGSESLKGVTQG
jgi:hypothetical protein